jgi:hypothetical protein
MNFQAAISFQDDENIATGTGRGITLVFEAEDAADAVNSLRRWWLCRHRAAPKHFRKLGCVKLYTYDITRVSDDGGCRTGTTAFPFYEWKSDTLGRGAGPIHFLTGDT